MAGVKLEGTDLDPPELPDWLNQALGPLAPFGRFEAGLGQALWKDLRNSYDSTAQGVQDLGMGAMGYKAPLSDASDPLTLATGGHITPAGENIIQAMGMRALGGPANPNELGIFGGSGAKLPPTKTPGNWFLGVDGKPRFEINDAQAGFREGPPENLLNAPLGMSYKAPAEQVFHHPELYKQYPDLAKIPIRTKTMDPETWGAANAPGEPYAITINAIRQDPKTGKIRLTTKDEMTDVALHEFQHVVQDKEGFAPGGSPEVAQYDLHNLAVQAEQRADAARQAGNLREYVGNLHDAHNLYAMEKDPYTAYHNLAGEVEARNVQTRWGIQNRQRINLPLSELGIHPASTEDVFRNRQFIFPEPVDHDPFSPPSPTNPHPVEGNPFGGRQEARVLGPDTPLMGNAANDTLTKAQYEAQQAKVAAKLEELANRLLPGQTWPLPQKVKDALGTVGQLGFDSTGGAIRAVRGHPDWASRWDVDPNRSLMEYKAHKTIKDYIHDTGGHGAGAQPPPAAWYGEHELDESPDDQ